MTTAWSNTANDLSPLGLTAHRIASHGRHCKLLMSSELKMHYG
jgi:hypothetical protein